MAPKKHGHYCKICGMLKSNESFSGKGHAAHICKACAKLPPEEKSVQMTMNKLENMAFRRLSASDYVWLRNRMKDRRPEVAELAKQIYAVHHPSNSEVEN